MLFRWEHRIHNMGPKRGKEHSNGKGKQKASAPFPPPKWVNVSYFPFYSSFLLKKPEKLPPHATSHARQQGVGGTPALRTKPHLPG